MNRQENNLNYDFKLKKKKNLILIIWCRDIAFLLSFTSRLLLAVETHIAFLLSLTSRLLLAVETYTGHNYNVI